MPAFLHSLLEIFRRHERLSLTSMGGLILTAIVGIGFCSLFLLNDKAARGYQITKLDNEYQMLKEDQEVTDMLALRARSMEVIKAGSMDMVKPAPSSISYVMPVAVAQSDSVNTY